jgi:AhpD family alkylhydroperoxidase
MDNELEAMSRRRKNAHAQLVARDSAFYRAFLEMEQAAFADGELPKKVKELIAVGISVVINCESCMQWHIEQAVLAGAVEREVLEAIEVGMEMGGGPATAHARFALEVMASAFAADNGRGKT